MAEDFNMRINEIDDFDILKKTQKVNPGSVSDPVSIEAQGEIAFPLGEGNELRLPFKGGVATNFSADVDGADVKYVQESFSGYKHEGKTYDLRVLRTEDRSENRVVAIETDDATGAQKAYVLENRGNETKHSTLEFQRSTALENTKEAPTPIPEDNFDPLETSAQPSAAVNPPPVTNSNSEVIGPFSLADAGRKLFGNMAYSKAGRKGHEQLYKDEDWSAYKFGANDGNKIANSLRDFAYGASDTLSSSLIPAVAVGLVTAAMGCVALPAVCALVAGGSLALKGARIKVENSDSQLAGMAWKNNFGTEGKVAVGAAAVTAAVVAVGGLGLTVASLGIVPTAVAAAMVSGGVGLSYLGKALTSEVGKFTEAVNTARGSGRG